MVVTCGKCDTQFRLDDSKVGSGGLRVRCSICKNAFLVEPPAPKAEADPSELAGKRVDGLAQAALDGESDLAPEVTRDLEDAWDAPGSEDLALGAADERVDLAEESDWVFDEEAFPTEEPQAAERSGPASGARDPETDAGEDLGSPDEWDFFEEGEGDGLAERAPLAFRGSSLSEAHERSAPPAAGVAFEEPPGRMAPWLRRIGEGLGWASVAALFLVGLHTGVTPRPETPRSAPAAQHMGSLVAERVAARWVENAVAGPVYVVSGQLRNTGVASAPAGERVALLLLDAAGDPLGLPPVALGPALSVQELRERDPAELRRGQEHGSLRLAGSPLGPGERWLFDAVLMDLPEAAARFRFETLAAPEPPAQSPRALPPGGDAGEGDGEWEGEGAPRPEASLPGSPPSPA